LLVSVGRALEAIPRMRPNMILHAGPPITWERMSAPLQGAVIGALLYEGVVGTEDEARDMASRGRAIFEPAQEHRAICSVSGVISPSMPVCIIRDETYGNMMTLCALNEGPGRVLRYGAFKAEALERLKWVEKTLAPVLRQGIAASGGIDLRSILSQALHMGDEGHQLTKAAMSLFIRTLAPHLVRTCPNHEMLAQVLSFLDGHNPFFQNLAMAAAKAALDAAHGIPGSRIVTAMAGNGTDFGIRVSGLGESWFVAPVSQPGGMFLPGYSQADANPPIGDGPIMESYGLGAFALAGAPTVMAFIGGTAAEAREVTQEMYGITQGESTAYTLPSLDLKGVPTGIDVQRVAATGSAPWLNIEIIHKEPGTGAIGAGLWRAPLSPFQQAAQAMGQDQTT